MTEQMSEVPAAPPVAAAGPAGGHWRAVRWGFVLRWAAIGTVLTGTGIAALLAGLLYFNLEQHPVVGRYVRDKVVAALEQRLGAGMKVGIDQVDLRRSDHETVVQVAGIHLSRADGKRVIDAPAGTLFLDSSRLMTLQIVPRRVEVAGLKVALEIDETGALGVGDPGATPAGGVGLPPPLVAPTDPLKTLGEAIGAGFAGLSLVREALGGSLPEVGLKQAAFSLNDRRSGRMLMADGVGAVLSTLEGGTVEARADVAMAGANYTLTASLSPPGGASQTMRLKSERLDFADFARSLGLHTPASLQRTPVELALDAEVDGERMARSARVSVKLGPLALQVTHDGPPLALTRSEAVVTWAPGASDLAVEALTFDTGANQLRMKGVLAPPRAAEGVWRARLAATETMLDGLTAGDQPVLLPEIATDLSWSSVQQAIGIESLRVAGPQAEVLLTGLLGLGEGREAVKLDLTARQTEARAALRLWPPYFAPTTRNWLVDHVKGGQLNDLALKIDFGPEAFAAVAKEMPLPEGSVAARWNLTNASVQALAETPVIRGVTSTGRASARRVDVDMQGGTIEMGNRRLTLGASQFVVPSTAVDVPEARFRARFEGGADALVALARTPGLRPFAPNTIDPARLRGTAEGEVSLVLKLKHKIAPADVRVGLNAALKGVTLETGFARQNLEAGQFQLQVDRDAVQIRGEARLAGVPAQIDLKGSAGGAAQAQVSMLLDDAARARQGIQLGSAVTGPVQVRLLVPLSEQGTGDITAEFDLTRIALNEPLPGWSKKAGAPGKARAVLEERDGGGLSLGKLEVDAGGVQLRGQVDLGRDGSFQKAQLSSFKLSPGDNVQVEAERVSGMNRIVVRGNAFDMRPFLKSVQTGSLDRANARDTEILLKTTVLSGFGGELASNAEIRMEKRGSDLKRFDLTGRFDGGPVTVRLEPQAGRAPRLKVEAADAGAFLRFFDLYSRMRGGHLVLETTLASGSQNGTMMVRDFALRDEPAMKRLTSDLTTQSAGEESSQVVRDAGRRRTNLKDVPFTKMTVSFARTPGRLEVKDAVMWGPEIGGSITGVLDYLRDRVNLTGTFVPAYSLNNMFAQVPVLGPLLGGGRNEGLFAVRYSISGALSAPTLTIDPLTALAPGFLRKIIDFRGHAQQRATQPAN